MGTEVTQIFQKFLISQNVRKKNSAQQNTDVGNLVVHQCTYIKTVGTLHVAVLTPK